MRAGEDDGGGEQEVRRTFQGKQKEEHQLGWVLVGERKLRRTKETASLS